MTINGKDPTFVVAQLSEIGWRPILSMPFFENPEPH